MINQLKNTCRKVRGQFAPKIGGSFDWILQQMPKQLMGIATPTLTLQVEVALILYCLRRLAPQRLQPLPIFTNPRKPIFLLLRVSTPFR